MPLVVAHRDSFDHRLLRSHRFALVAAEYRDRLPPNVMAPSISSGELADSAELTPGLISLNQLTASQFDALTARLEEDSLEGRAPLLSALLETDVSADRVVSHVAAVQLQSGPRGERAWLRIHDPRVWVHLPRIVEPARVRAFFGPMTAWSVCIGGSWVRTTPPVDAKISALITKFRHDPRQWAALQRIGVVNRVLARYGWLSYRDIVERSAAIDDLVARGQSRHDLTSVADLVEYAILGTTIHSRFDELPVALNAIKAHAENRRPQDADDDASVMDELRAIPDAQWIQAIREAAEGTTEQQDEQRQKMRLLR